LNQWLIGSAKTTPVSNISNFSGMIYNDTLWMACVAGYNGNNIFGMQNEWLCLGPQVWTGIDNVPANADNSLLLYPNPASTILKVKCSHDVQTFEIFNVVGAISNYCKSIGYFFSNRHQQFEARSLFSEGNR
jgi:hypothetical protein